MSSIISKRHDGVVVKTAAVLSRETCTALPAVAALSANPIANGLYTRSTFMAREELGLLNAAREASLNGWWPSLLKVRVLIPKPLTLFWMVFADQGYAR